MTGFRIIFGFAALALALPLGVVWAQGDLPGEQLTSLQLANNTVLVVTPDGRAVERSMPPTHLDRMMAGAQPVSSGTILVERNGRLFMVPDHAMPNGRMLSQHLATMR